MRKFVLAAVIATLGVAMFAIRPPHRSTVTSA